MIESPPNILFITSHDLGRHLGCYGVSTVQTPALDDLACTGFRFGRAFSTAPLCSPSRASMFTGRCPHRTGVNGLTHGGFGWEMEADQVHLARYLADAGYHCEQIGTMHETHQPAERWGYAAHHVDPQGTATEIATAAERRIAAMSTPGSRPWYLHLGFYEPHTPFKWRGATHDCARGVTRSPWFGCSTGAPSADA